MLFSSQVTLIILDLRVILVKSHVFPNKRAAFQKWISVSRYLESWVSQNPFKVIKETAPIQSAGLLETTLIIILESHFNNKKCNFKCLISLWMQKRSGYCLIKCFRRYHPFCILAVMSYYHRMDLKKYGYELFPNAFSRYNIMCLLSVNWNFVLTMINV